MKIDNSRNRRAGPPGTRDYINKRGRIAIVKGQDRSRFTDFYHMSLMAPWPVFLLGLAVLFALINAVFALLYMAQPGGLLHARPGDFWDAFVFSVQTMGSIAYTEITPKSHYADVLVMVEAFVGILYIGVVTAVMFARLSRPSARVVFSKVAVVVPYDSVPTLMFRAANQRGNQVLDASVRVSLAHQATSREGMAMRRFDELKLVRSRTSLFALSWTIMHAIDETSPLHGRDEQCFLDQEMELLVLLSGTDDVLADTIYARHVYSPENIRWGHRFVDVLGVNAHGRRVVDLTRFDDTEPQAVEMPVAAQ